MRADLAKILYDARWIGQHGIGRFAGELAKFFPNMQTYRRDRRPWHPLDPALLGRDLRYLEPKLFFSPGYNSPLGWNKPFVFALHDLNHLRVPENSNALKRAYYRYVIRPACRRASFVLTVSEFSRDEIISWAGVDEQKVINVGNGVGEPFSPDGPRNRPGFPYLLYVGSHKPHKNLPRLLRAYAAAGISHDAHLVLTGRPDAALQAVIEEARLADMVHFIGRPDNNELARLYRGAVALLFPSLYEGFGLPPLEAMACGTPVLTSNIGALPEVVGDSAILVDPTNIQAISEGIRTLLRSESTRRDLRQKGLSRAARFTWQATAEKTAHLLDKAFASI